MNWEEFKDYDLSELIEYLSLKDDSEGKEWADSAFANITFQYRKQLLIDCTRMCLKNGFTETDAEEITNRVLERVYQYPSFNFEKCRVNDIEKCFRFYLMQIARHEFADFVTPDDPPYDGEEKIIETLIDYQREYDKETLKSLKEREAQLDKIFAKLSTKHKVIYLTYMLHEKEGRKLPRKLLEELRGHLGLSQTSIRVYKKEAFELVNKELHGK